MKKFPKVQILGQSKEAEKFLKKLNEIKSWVVRYDKVALAMSELEVAYEFLMRRNFSRRI